MQYKGYEVVPLKEIPCGKRYITRMHARNNHHFTLEVIEFTQAGDRKRVAIIAADFILRLTGYHCTNDIPEVVFRGLLKKFCGADKDTLMSTTAMELLKEYGSFLSSSRV